VTVLVEGKDANTEHPAGLGGLHERDLDDLSLLHEHAHAYLLHRCTSVYTMCTPADMGIHWVYIWNIKELLEICPDATWGLTN